MPERMVQCRKLGREAPGLTEPPFGGELGKQIFENVSAEVWKQWNDDVMIKIINEYRLDMTDEKQYNVLLDQMRSFLGLDAGGSVLETENAERGRGLNK
ncbi:MAG: oxidative damage protection protein [Bdellovibrionota bacterium]